MKFCGIKFKVYNSTIEDNKWVWKDPYFGLYKEKNSKGIFFGFFYLWWKY